MRSVRTLARSAIGKMISSLAKNKSIQKTSFNSIRLNRPEFSCLWSKKEVRFLSYVFAMREKSKSQIMQDLWVCFELENKMNGFFVEFGATNGLLNSNTWLLEKELNWRGILAEPNPFWHRDLSANRSAIIEHKCVSSRSGELVAFTVTDNSDPELSGITRFSAGEHFSTQRDHGATINVETISLNDLLDIHRAPNIIDYMSIDTEGSELDIISSFDFTNRSFGLISIEINTKTENQINQILRNHGYIRVFSQFSQWDAWFVSAKLKNRNNPVIFAPAA
jgi:FkbM family methyltransferase